MRTQHNTQFRISSRTMAKRQELLHYSIESPGFKLPHTVTSNPEKLYLVFIHSTAYDMNILFGKEWRSRKSWRKIYGAWDSFPSMLTTVAKFVSPVVPVRYDNSMPESTISPSQALRILLHVKMLPWAGWRRPCVYIVVPHMVAAFDDSACGRT
jgi:hypothetical protein